MKQYPKLYEDIYRQSVNNKFTTPGKITSTYGSPEILADKFKAFYKEAHAQLFDQTVKQVWLEQQFIYDGTRRNKRRRMGFAADWGFGYFIQKYVGTSQKATTINPIMTAVATYLKDFFPEFLEHDPFEDPEYYVFPFKNISLDHLVFVYQVVDMRLDMLKHAEANNMTTGDFKNWAINHVLCNNDETGEDVYELTITKNASPHIRNNSLVATNWTDELYNFEK